MTTTVRPPRHVQLNGGRAGEAGRASAPRAPSGLRRNRSRIALGLVVITLSVLGVVAIVSRSSERQQVLVLVNDIPAGAQITAADLTVVDLPVDTPLPLIPATETDQIVGRSALVTLLRGTPLQHEQLAADARIPEGMALLGTVLDPGQYPVDLRQGDEVRLVESAPATTASDSPVVTALGLGEVREMGEPPTGTGALVVSLLVPEPVADTVSAAGSQGRISLVVVGSR